MRQGKIVLLVEDNPDDEALTRRAFKKNHINNTIVAVRDGMEALDYLFCRGQHANRSPRATPSIIFLDLKLPKVDGLEVLREIRRNEHTKLLPVVVLTSSKHERDLIESYSLGANSYIRKPVDFSQFCETIRQLSNYWLTLNEPPPQADSAS